MASPTAWDRTVDWLGGLASKMYTYDPKTAGRQVAATVSRGKAPQLRPKVTVIPSKPVANNKEVVRKAAPKVTTVAPKESVVVETKKPQVVKVVPKVTPTSTNKVIGVQAPVVETKSIPDAVQSEQVLPQSQVSLQIMGPRASSQPINPQPIVNGWGDSSYDSGPITDEERSIEEGLAAKKAYENQLANLNSVHWRPAGMETGSVNSFDLELARQQARRELNNQYKIPGVNY